MRSIYKKRWLLGMLLVIIIAVVYVLNQLDNSKGVVSPGVKEEMVEVLPNGENKVVKTLNQVDTATLERLVQQEAALKLVIAQDTKLESEDVSVSLAPLSNLEDTERLQLSCSIVLNTVSTFDKKIINNVLEDILNTFEESSDMHVSKENIVMVNSNNEVLY